MKAKIVTIRAGGAYTAQTDNDIALVFRLRDAPDDLALGDVIEVDLPNVVAQKTIVRLRDGRSLRIDLREDDLHDLRVPAKHGRWTPLTTARLKGN